MNNIKFIIKALAGTMMLAATASQATELVKVETNNNLTLNDIRIELTHSLQAINVQSLKVEESAKTMLLNNSNTALQNVEVNQNLLLIATAD